MDNEPVYTERYEHWIIYRAEKALLIHCEPEHVDSALLEFDRYASLKGFDPNTRRMVRASLGIGVVNVAYVR